MGPSCLDRAPIGAGMKITFVGLRYTGDTTAAHNRIMGSTLLPERDQTCSGWPRACKKPSPLPDLKSQPRSLPFPN